MMFQNGRKCLPSHVRTQQGASSRSEGHVGRLAYVLSAAAMNGSSACINLMRSVQTVHGETQIAYNARTQIDRLIQI